MGCTDSRSTDNTVPAARTGFDTDERALVVSNEKYYRDQAETYFNYLDTSSPSHKAPNYFEKLIRW